MIDISKETVKLDCPECHKGVTVALKQVADEALVKCSCGQEIQLIDSNDSGKKVIRDINKSFQDFEKTLKKLGK